MKELEESLLCDVTNTWSRIHVIQYVICPNNSMMVVTDLYYMVAFDDLQVRIFIEENIFLAGGFAGGFLIGLATS